MTRSDERAERSKKRSMEHQRKRRRDIALVSGALVLYVVVPLLWYAGLEVGWVRPIQSPELKTYLSLARSIALLAGIYAFIRLFEASRKTQAEKESNKVPTSVELTKS